MSVSPGSRSSPGFCHICRQGNRSAQKQIICPIYRGWPARRPHRKGLEQKNFAEFAAWNPLERLSQNSFFRKPENRGFLRPIQRVTGRAAAQGNSPFDVYSAAAAKDGFLFAAEIMKSEMRGTISDLKREPLKTP